MHASRLVARTRSVDETRDLAASLVPSIRPGDLLLLAGDLGAGKTAFVQGLGRALGVTEPITSPTFTLAQRYDGEMVLHHLDVYRLAQLNEVVDLGLGELLDEGGVVAIEWGDAVIPVLPSDYLEVRLTMADVATPDRREVELQPVGPAWAARQRALAEAIGPWRTAAGGGGSGDVGDVDSLNGGHAGHDGRADSGENEE
jgi:tRNA threonylcarbamoyladenosine biosynthesis protein TsaE